MIRYAVLVAAAAGLVLAVPTKPLPPVGSWQVDTRHSHAQLAIDGTTDFGKSKIMVTVGFARMNGTVKLDGDNSAFDFRLYPASSMAPPIDEDGNAKIEWFSNHANNTLVCFHSKGVKPTGEGRVQTSGKLTLTRVDRNVELTPSEGYTGPVYGPPVLHRVSREATFVFDFPGAATNSHEGEMLAVGTTRVSREDFPQLLKTVVATYWPPVVQDKNCQIPAGFGEDYSGAMCTGTFLQPPALPSPPSSAGGEDYPGPGGFNSLVGDRLRISVHMHLASAGSGAQAGAAN
jgi:polyisoprenoid-binding protein YceI